MSISFYDQIDVVSERNINQASIVSWLHKWYELHPGQKSLNPEYWLEQAKYFLSGANFKRMESGLSSISEQARNQAVFKWWREVSQG